MRFRTITKYTALTKLRYRTITTDTALTKVWHKRKSSRLHYQRHCTDKSMTQKWKFGTSLSTILRWQKYGTRENLWDFIANDTALTKVRDKRKGLEIFPQILYWQKEQTKGKVRKYLLQPILHWQNYDRKVKVQDFITNDTALTKYGTKVKVRDFITNDTALTKVRDFITNDTAVTKLRYKSSGLHYQRYCTDKITIQK